MANTNNGWTKFFFGLGILTVISGAYLIVQGLYVVGIPGSIVGAFIAWQNIQAINSDSGTKDGIGK